MGRKTLFVLSGCGHMDGSEIHEAVSALIALDRRGFDIEFAAPDIEQTVTKNALEGEQTDEKRNVLVESARIARGSIRPLSEVDPADYDLVVFPGGFGAALNLCTFATEGESCTVNPDVRRIIEKTHAAGKPIGAMCIAPVIPARIIPGVKVTIGNDPSTAAKIEDMGGKHMNCAVDDAVVDPENRVVTTPAYMLAQRPSQVYAGAERMVEELERLLG